MNRGPTDLKVLWAADARYLSCEHMTMKHTCVTWCQAAAVLLSTLLAALYPPRSVCCTSVTRCSVKQLMLYTLRVPKHGVLSASVLPVQIKQQATASDDIHIIIVSTVLTVQ